MKLPSLAVRAVAFASLSSVAQGQQVTLNQQSFGICSGTTLSSYSHWLAVASGATCNSGTPSNVGGFINGGLNSSGTLDWTFLDGPVPFNGLYVSGYGSFFIDLMDGETVLHTASFTVYGSDVFVGTPGFSGSVTRIRIRRQSGIGAFGLGENGFVGIPGNQNIGSNPPGNGPSGNGPPGAGPSGNGPNGNDPSGNGPNGNGPNGNGPNGNGPNGSGPNGNGPPGPNDNDGPWNNQGGPNDEGPGGDDELNSLVNEPNATPEPATLLLVASGLGGVGALTRLRRKSARKTDNA